MIILGLGSNLGDRQSYLRQARTLLDQHQCITVEQVSSIYETEPVGVKDQPNFLNAIVSIKTTLTPEELLDACMAIEQKLGRIRDKRWGPRTIDIDILIYNDIEVSLERLVIPHPRLAERRFVLLPLQELMGEKPLLCSITVLDLLATTKDNSNVHLYCSCW